MFLLRTSRIAPAARAFTSVTTSRAPFATLPRLASGSDYGSGEQKNEKNLESASHDKEHPGPAPPSTGNKGSGGGSGGSGGSSSSNEKHVESGSESSSTGSASGAQPKLHSHSPPKEHEQSQEVKEHNKDVKERVEGTFQSKEKNH